MEKIKNIIILLIIFLFFIKIWNIEYFDDKSIIINFETLKQNILDDTTIPKIIKLSPTRTIYLYNYIFNYSENDYIQNYLIDTIDVYLYQICFVRDFNLIKPIIEIINKIIKEKYNIKKRIGPKTYVQDLIKIIKDGMRKILYNNLILSFNKYNVGIFNDELIIKHTLNLLLDGLDDELKYYEFRNLLINKLYSNGVIYKELNIEDNKHYNNYVNCILEIIIKYINSVFLTKYDNLNKKSLFKIRNLLYSGDFIKFNFNMVFCEKNIIN